MTTTFLDFSPPDTNQRGFSPPDTNQRRANFADNELRCGKCHEQLTEDQIVFVDYRMFYSWVCQEHGIMVLTIE